MITFLGWGEAGLRYELSGREARVFAAMEPKERAQLLEQAGHVFTEALEGRLRKHLVEGPRDEE